MSIGRIVCLVLALVAGLMASPAAAQQNVITTNADVAALQGRNGTSDFPTSVFVAEGNRVEFTIGVGLSFAIDRHPSEISRIILTRDQKRLITYSEQLGGTIHVLSIPNLTLEREYQIGIASDIVTIGNLLLALKNDGKFHFFNLQTGAEVNKLVGRPNDIIVARTMELSPSGKLLGIAETNGVIRVISTDTWQLVHAVKLSGEFASATFVNDNTLVAGDDNGYGYILDPLQKKVTGSFNFRSRVNCLAVVSSTTVAFGLENGLVQFRNLVTGAQSRQMSVGRPVYYLAVAKNNGPGGFIAAAGQERRFVTEPL